MAELYKQKEYKRVGSFVKACGKAIADLTGEYADDVLTYAYDEMDERNLKKILMEDGEFAYDDDFISIDFNINSHIFVYVPE